MSLASRVRDRRARRALDQTRARWDGPRTAFVLSGGGVLGAVQVGHLLALLEAGIVPDVVIGASVGSLNAAMVAMDPTVEGMQRLADIWRSLKTEDIFPGSRVTRAWNIVARGDHLHSNEGIRRLVERLPARTFEQARIPLYVCSTNLASGEETWFSSGPLVRAILASTALPGVYPPVQIDGNLYVDGGVVNNVPISKAVELGARRIYVLTCGAPSTGERPIRRPLDVLIHSFAHSRGVRTRLDLEQYASEAEIIMMPTFEVHTIRYNDPSHSAELTARAYEESVPFLAHAAEQRA
jgi:NTE family protein